MKNPALPLFCCIFFALQTTGQNLPVLVRDSLTGCRSMLSWSAISAFCRQDGSGNACQNEQLAGFEV